MKHLVKIRSHRETEVLINWQSLKSRVGNIHVPSERMEIDYWSHSGKIERWVDCRVKESGRLSLKGKSEAKVRETRKGERNERSEGSGQRREESESMLDGRVVVGGVKGERVEGREEGATDGNVGEGGVDNGEREGLSRGIEANERVVEGVDVREGSIVESE